jgi:DNA invertase Pin-like site-specific DNA recombinase
MAKQERVALYLRVSRDVQTTDNQRLELERICEARGWTIVHVYQDEGISGATGRDKRPGLKAMLADAQRRKFDRVVAWAVDRLGRSTATVATAMAELDAIGVRQFYSKEAIDTSTPHGRAMIQMAAVFGELELAMTKERINAGLARARAQGKVLGRPIKRDKHRRKVLAERAKEKGIRKIARELRIGVGTVKRILSDAA